MKIKDIHDELVELAKNSGISIRRENGNFRSGYAVLKEQQLIIINKSTPIEFAAGVIARTLPEDVLDSNYIKPVIREYIEKEREQSLKFNPDFSLKVDY